MTYIYLSKQPITDRLKYENGEIDFPQIKIDDIVWFLWEEREVRLQNEMLAKGETSYGTNANAKTEAY